MKFIPVAVIAFALMFLPADTVLAQGGLVTCSGADCGSCQLVAMINLIIVWLIGILFMLFAVMMVVAGFGLVTSGGNQSALEAAKSKFTNAIIGIIIVIAAWLIVDTVMKGLVGGGSSGAAMGELVGWGPWSRVQCTAQAVPQAYVQPPGVTATTTATTTQPALCSDDAALMAQYSGSPVGVEHPQLRTMISCYTQDPAVSALVDRGQIYTVDRSHPRCSLTNGNRACGPCSHSVGSTHYGRGSGLGAMAVDFNAIGGRESELRDRLSARRAQCGGTILFEGDHTHISL